MCHQLPSLIQPLFESFLGLDYPLPPSQSSHLNSLQFEPDASYSFNLFVIYKKYFNLPDITYIQLRYWLAFFIASFLRDPSLISMVRSFQGCPDINIIASSQLPSESSPLPNNPALFLLLRHVFSLSISSPQNQQRIDNNQLLQRYLINPHPKNSSTSFTSKNNLNNLTIPEQNPSWNSFQSNFSKLPSNPIIFLVYSQNEIFSLKTLIKSNVLINQPELLYLFLISSSISFPKSSEELISLIKSECAINPWTSFAILIYLYYHFPINAKRLFSHIISKENCRLILQSRFLKAWNSALPFINDNFFSAVPGFYDLGKKNFIHLSKKVKDAIYYPNLSNSELIQKARTDFSLLTYLSERDHEQLLETIKTLMKDNNDSYLQSLILFFDPIEALKPNTIQTIINSTLEDKKLYELGAILFYMKKALTNSLSEIKSIQPNQIPSIISGIPKLSKKTAFNLLKTIYQNCYQCYKPIVKSISILKDASPEIIEQITHSSFTGLLTHFPFLKDKKIYPDSISRLKFNNSCLYFIQQAFLLLYCFDFSTALGLNEINSKSENDKKISEEDLFFSNIFKYL